MSWRRQKWQIDLTLIKVILLTKLRSSMVLRIYTLQGWRWTIGWLWLQRCCRWAGAEAPLRHDYVLKALNNSSSPWCNALHREVICVIRMLCRDSAQVSWVNKWQKLYWEQAGQFTFPWEQRMLVLGPGLLPAPAATVQLTWSLCFSALEVPPALTPVWPPEQEAWALWKPRRLELFPFLRCHSLSAFLLPPTSLTTLSGAPPRIPPLLLKLYLFIFSKLLFGQLFIPFPNKLIHSLDFHTHTEISQNHRPGKSSLSPLLQYSKNHCTHTHSNFLLFQPFLSKYSNP